jgi:mandelate racemase
VVTWTSELPDDRLSGVRARRYDWSGAPVSGEFRVNTFTTGYQTSVPDRGAATGPLDRRSPRPYVPRPVTAPALTFRGLRVRPVNVPMARPLRTAGGVVETAPLVLIDLETAEGITGRSYLFCYTPLALAPVARLLEGLGGLLKDAAVVPFELERALQQRFRLLGPQGLTGMAMAGVDMACWDVAGQAAGLPLVRLLGGARRPLRAYNSNGLGLVGEDAAAREAVELLDGGFQAIKVRLGYATLAEDLAVVRAVRKAVGPAVTLMADYNQSLDVPEAVRRAQSLDEEGLEWIEEPVRADDYEGCARVAEAARTPIQIGENCWGPLDLARAIRARSADRLMPDAMKIGGVTGWLRAAALTQAAGVPTSTHLFPETSAHLLAVTPTADWVEYVDWAGPILRAPLALAGGHVTAPDRPGLGLEWDDAAVARLVAG